MSSEPTLVVAVSRIQQLIDVLSLLSLGEYDPKKMPIEVGGEDDRLSFLEESLGIFFEELVEARDQNVAHIAKLERNQRELEAKLATIERQRDAIRELSTPIIELWDEIVTLPVVGLVDSHRSVEMTEALLERIHERGYRCVIIDVTGVQVIDTLTANHFLTMVQAAQLLGAHCVLTGMSPSIAQTIAGLGFDMAGLPTLRSLAEGLKHCLRHLSGAPRKGGKP